MPECQDDDGQTDEDVEIVPNRPLHIRPLNTVNHVSETELTGVDDENEQESDLLYNRGVFELVNEVMEGEDEPCGDLPNGHLAFSRQQTFPT